MSMRDARAPLMFGALLMALAGCREPHAVTKAADEAATRVAPAAAQETLMGGGSTFVFPLMTKWVEGHPAANRTAIKYTASGSGAGVKGVLAGELDFGVTDSSMTDDELSAAPRKLAHVPIALGAVSLAYNGEGLEDRVQLSARAVAGIFLGEITNWKDARIAASNPSRQLPDLPITVVYRSDASGTTAVFTKYLSRVTERWHTGMGASREVAFPLGLAAHGNDGVAGLIKQTPGAIGCVELTTAKLARLHVASVENASGRFVEPTLASITAAAANAAGDMSDDLRVSIVNSPDPHAYPIASFSFALVDERAKASAVASFLWWAVHDGQRFAAPLFYAPLPREIVARVEHKLMSLPDAREALSAY